MIWRWVKMSKSLRQRRHARRSGRAQYGADALRVYEMFVAPFEETVQWSEEGIRGSSKFLRRVYTLVAQYGPATRPTGAADWTA